MVVVAEKTQHQHQVRQEAQHLGVSPLGPRLHLREQEADLLQDQELLHFVVRKLSRFADLGVWIRGQFGEDLVQAQPEQTTS